MRGSRWGSSTWRPRGRPWRIERSRGASGPRTGRFPSCNANGKRRRDSCATLRGDPQGSGSNGGSGGPPKKMPARVKVVTRGPCCLAVRFGARRRIAFGWSRTEKEPTNCRSRHPDPVDSPPRHPDPRLSGRLAVPAPPRIVSSRVPFGAPEGEIVGIFSQQFHQKQRRPDHRDMLHPP